MVAPGRADHADDARINFVSAHTLAVAGVVFVLAAAVLAWQGRAQNVLKIVVFDVGQGDAIYVSFPSGERWLIDGGPDATVRDHLDRELPFGDRRLTGVMLTHPHADHVTGLISVLREYDVGAAVFPVAEHTTPTYQTFLELVRAEPGLTAIPVAAPFAWSGVSNDVPWQWTFLHPQREFREPVVDLNSTSLVSRLTYGDHSFLFTGDADEAIERLLIAQHHDLDALFLKVGHQGSDTSSSLPFLEIVSPAVAAVSVGAGNKFGHPSPTVLERLAGVGADIYRTDERGSVVVESDGKRYLVHTDR